MTVRTATEPLLGDSVPVRVAEYYRALDEARFADAVAPFTSDALYAVPAGGAIETAPRTETRGRDDLRRRFHERGPRPWAHDVLLCVVDGQTCLLEGVTRDSRTGQARSSFAASMQLDDGGSIRRYLAFATPLAVEPPRGDATQGSARAEAATVLGRYFAALDDGSFEAAAACFSEDVLYSHPPYKHTGVDGQHRVERRGRPNLLAKFRERGAQRFDHRVLACVQRGRHCMVEGLVEGLPAGATGSFVSSLTLDADGLIRRYLSFYCEPGVGGPDR